MPRGRADLCVAPAAVQVRKWDVRCPFQARVVEASSGEGLAPSSRAHWQRPGPHRLCLPPAERQRPRDILVSRPVTKPEPKWSLDYSCFTETRLCLKPGGGFLWPLACRPRTARLLPHFTPPPQLLRWTVHRARHPRCSGEEVRGRPWHPAACSLQGAQTSHRWDGYITRMVLPDPSGTRVLEASCGVAHTRASPLRLQNISVLCWTRAYGQRLGKGDTVSLKN